MQFTGLKTIHFTYDGPVMITGFQSFGMDGQMVSNPPLSFIVLSCMLPVPGSMRDNGIVGGRLLPGKDFLTGNNCRSKLPGDLAGTLSQSSFGISVQVNNFMVYLFVIYKSFFV